MPADLREYHRVGFAVATLSAICTCPQIPRRRDPRTATYSVPATRLTCPDLSIGLVQGPAEGRPADVTITATTQALKAFIFAGSEVGIDITGETGAVQRFRQLISTMATVVHPV